MRTMPATRKRPPDGGVASQLAHRRAGPRPALLNVRIRSFRQGDEKAIAALFNQYVAQSVGPSLVTPRSWRDQYRHHGWSGPSLDADRDCVRVALRRGEIIGYLVVDFEYIWDSDVAVVQELCIAEGEQADELARQLLEDAERQAGSRAKHVLMLALSNEDGHALRAATALGFDGSEDGGDVFMAAITNLAAFLRQIAPELTRRMQASRFRAWRGTIPLRSGEMEGGLRLQQGAVEAVRARGTADLSASIHPEALPSLLFGQLSVARAFLQDRLSVSQSEGSEQAAQHANRTQALQVLDALFPRVPLYMPRAQWW